MKKIFRIMIVIATLCCLSTTAFAKEVEEDYSIREKQENNIKIGALYKNGDGVAEKIIKVNEDGSFVTESLELPRSFAAKSINARSVKNCQHVKLLEIYTKTETSNVATKSCCYKSRKIIKSRCAQCSKTFTTYGKWEKHKEHSYKLFGKTCKVCGYKK